MPGRDLAHMPPALPELQAARIVAGTLTLLSREMREMGRPVDLWSPPLYPDHIREIAVRVGRGEALPLWVEERHPARGLAVFADSPRESDFFAYRCARLMGPFMVAENQRDREGRVRRLAGLAIEQGRAQGCRLITLKTFHDPAVLRGFLAEGFILAEIGASLGGAVPEYELPVDRPTQFDFPSADDFREIAGEAVEALGDFFYDGHFRHDPDLGPEAARRLWSRIARDDLEGAADPAVLLWDRKKDQAAGLATVHLVGQEARLSILAVSQAYQGRGLGRLIMHEILNRLRGRAAHLAVETASYNLPALKLYQSLGLVSNPPLAALHYHHH